jgi:hypothetical protein
MPVRCSQLAWCLVWQCRQCSALSTQSDECVGWLVLGAGALPQRLQSDRLHPEDRAAGAAWPTERYEHVEQACSAFSEQLTMQGSTACKVSAACGMDLQQHSEMQLQGGALQGL